MSRSILSRGFQSQPPAGVQLDLGNPLLTNIRRLWSTHEGRLKEYIVQRSVNVELIERPRLGISGNFTVNNATNLFGTENPCNSGDLTVFAVVELNATAVNQSLVGRNFTGMTIAADTSQFCLGMTNGNSATFSVRDVGVGAVTCSSAAYPSGTSYRVLVGRVQGTSVTLFTDGGLTASGTLTVGLATTTVTQQYHIGNNPNVNGNFNGYASLIGVFDRALTNQEIQEISRNPWQIFKPLRSSIYISSTGRSGSMSAVEGTVDSFSGSGQVIIKGTFSATENTSDTSTITGKVIIKGTMSATEGTVDIFAGTGTTTGGRVGTANMTEGTRDTSSITGTILVQGSLNTTENTSDTFFATNVVAPSDKCVNSKWIVNTGTSSGTIQLQMASDVNGVDVTLKEGLFFLKYRKIN